MRPNSKNHCQAFTLIEVIGILTVIALLAALLVPKIFEAIDSARIANTLISIQTIKTAVLEHHGKFLSLASSNGTPLTVTNSCDNFDAILLAEGLIDKPFASKIGATTLIRLRNVSGPAYTPGASMDPKKGLSTYDLDGDGDNDIVGGQYLVEAVLVNVTLNDARALNDLWDGSRLGEKNSGQDFRGRVAYHKAGSNPLIVHIYLTHH